MIILNIELSEQRSPEVFFEQLIVAATILTVFSEFFFREILQNNFRKISHRFLIFSLHSFLRKSAKFRENNLRLQHLIKNS